MVDNAKIAVLTASILASVGGAVLLSRSAEPTVVGREWRRWPPLGTHRSSTRPSVPSELGPIRYEELNATAPQAYVANGSEVPDSPDMQPN